MSPDTHTVKIAASPINWHNDDFPRLGERTAVETILAEMRQAGYQGTELGSLYPTSPHDLRNVLDRYELQLASGWFSAYLLTRNLDDECARLDSFAKFLKAAGAHHITTAECSYCPFKQFGASPLEQNYRALRYPLFPSQLPELSEADWHRLGTGMTRLQEVAASHGLTLGYHPHIQTVVETKDQLAQLIQHAPDLKLTLDTGHLALSGADPVAVLNRYLKEKRVVHLHVKNIRQRVVEAARAGAMGFEFAVIEGVFTVPGDGGIDFTTIFDALRRNDYAGWLVVEAEQNPLTADPLLYAKLAREYIRSTAGW